MPHSAHSLLWFLSLFLTTGIILAGVGLTAGVIDERIFVAMVGMALATSLLAGPMMNWLLSDHFAALHAHPRQE